MTVIDSRVKIGLLEFSAGTAEWTAFSCQPTSVSVEPSYNESGDSVEVLCGNTLNPDATVSWALKLTAIQDFDNPQGLMVFLRMNILKDIMFRFTPNGTAEIVEGTCQARPGPWYGEVGPRITTDIEMPIAGTPTWTPQGAGPA